MDQVYSWYIFINSLNLYSVIFIYICIHIIFFLIQYVGHDIQIYIKDIIDRFIQRNILLYVYIILFNL